MDARPSVPAQSGRRWGPALRRGRDAWVLAALVFILAASFAAFFGWNTRHVDAKAYWDGGTRLRTGAALYADEPVPALAKAYLYPPAFAALLAPLTALPPLWGYATWMALQIAFAVALGHTCAALAGIRPADADGRRTALAIALAAGLAALTESLGEGQANLLLALLCARAVLEGERGRDARAGFALAAAVHIKLVPIVLAGAFFVWRRPRVLGWLAIALVVLGCAPLAWRIATFGVGAGAAAFATDYADFWRAILWPAAGADRVAGVEQLFAPNYAFRGTLSRLFVEGTALSPFPALADRRGPLVTALPPALVHGTSTLLGLAAIAAALWRCRRAATEPGARAAAAGLLLLAGALAGPSFWQHGFVLLSLVGAGLWRVLAPQPARAQALAWTWVAAPLALTMTLPFLAALVDGSGDLHRALREYGIPTAAAVNCLVAGLVLTRARGSQRAVPLTPSGT